MRGGRLRLAARCDSGAAAVEFAIVSLLLIFFFLAAFELGRAFYVVNNMGYAVDFGMRKILLNPDVDPATVEAEVRNNFQAGDSKLLTVAAPTGSTSRTITATYPLTLAVPFAGNSARVVTVQRTMTR